jgi:uncharacterized protein (TIGR00269 family)
MAALSGGKDSSSLLYMLKKYEKAFHTTVSAITIDEGIGGQSEKTVKTAEKLAKMLGVEHHVFSFEEEFGIRIDALRDRLKKGDANYCTYCGVLRRNLMNRKARELSADKLAVGINLDDEAQSIFMNFLRGDFSQFQRLGANPILVEDSKFAARIKPLRNIPEIEMALYATLNEIPFCGGRCKMPTATMRWEVKDILNGLEEKRPGTKLQIVSFYDRLKPMLSKKTSEKINYCECGEPTSQEGICRTCQVLEELGVRNKKRANRSL